MRSEAGGRYAHSFHAYFMRPGDAAAPVDIAITTPFDGRSFASREVTVRQNGQTILQMLVSFQRPEEGVRHQMAPPQRDGPEEARVAFGAWREERRRRGEPDLAARFHSLAIETAPIDPETLFGLRPGTPSAASWVRLRAPAPADPAIQRTLLAYVSDRMLLRASMLPHVAQSGTHFGFPGLRTTSLDHALWFHETPDLNDWLLFDTDSPWAGGARALNHGRFFTASGRLVASVTQENLLRVASERA
jgi:acyl-CoA thioesterase-2